MIARWPWLAALALAITIATPARAGDAVAAESLFRAGRDAMKRGDYVTACEKLAASESLEPASGTLLNLAECKQHVGALATAWALYHEAYDRLEGDPRQSIAKDGMAALEPRLAHVTVSLEPSAPKDATLARDGVDLGGGSFGTKLPIDAGSHTLVVRAAGREAKEYRLTIGDGESKSLTVTAGAALPADRGGNGTRTLGFVLGGVGLASLGVGVVTGVMTMHRKSIVDARCDRGLCPPDGVSAASEGKTLGAISTATFIAGGTLIAGGVICIVVGKSGAAVRVAGAF